VLIITGLGRCGTSFTMRVLQDLDFNLGINVSWFPKLGCGLELGSVHRINSEMYFRYLKKGLEINLDDTSYFRHWTGFTFRHILTKFDKDQRQGDFVDVVKDPRLTWHPDLIKIWWECRKDLKLLICHRDPEMVLRSRIIMGEGFEDPKDERMKDVNIFKQDFSDFLTEVMKLEIPYELIYFPNFIFKSELLYNGFVSLCPHFKEIKEDFYESFNKLIEPSRNHEE